MFGYSYVAGTYLGEKESYATYMAPDGNIKEQFKFSMDRNGYDEFAGKIPLETRIAFNRPHVKEQDNSTKFLKRYGNKIL
ncbi:MAG: hypothetical protein M1481_00230 [Candidatus Thermoplasmatota archaeon]|nr:hypothetical protein [Candidatus Thermoplasmatota archaeon]MCL5963883.1 hypothetical protein [Candidatus Thermoplasmatota archaeon]